ncbi:hypothetical protein KAR91_20910 [Candidatus Pacearchaeota archaeon]|nr:hypothetical protein [Candidatus Pacearchaeota archaeon]
MGLLKEIEIKIIQTHLLSLYARLNAARRRSGKEEFFSNEEYLTMAQVEALEAKLEELINEKKDKKRVIMGQIEMQKRYGRKHPYISLERVMNNPANENERHVMI